MAKFMVPTPEQAKQILEGYKNLAKERIGLEDDEIEKMAARRLAICASCPRKSENGKRCLECGCILEAKSRSETSECPLGKWA